MDKLASSLASQVDTPSEQMIRFALIALVITITMMVVLADLYTNVRTYFHTIYIVSCGHQIIGIYSGREKEIDR